MSAVFLTPDLMFSSRVMAAAAACGVSLRVVASSAALSQQIAPDCRLVLVDLVQPGVNISQVVAAVRATAPAAQIVAFGPHVDEALLTSARSAGCDQVLTRSQFQQRHAELLRDFGGGRAD